MKKHTGRCAQVAENCCGLPRLALHRCRRRHGRVVSAVVPGEERRLGRRLEGDRVAAKHHHH